MANTTETKLDRIIRAADGGGILANQILGSLLAVPTLTTKGAAVQGRIDRAAAGRVASNTDAEYARIIIGQVAAVADAMQYNHPDAARLAHASLTMAFRRNGLAGLVATIAELRTRAEHTAALAN